MTFSHVWDRLFVLWETTTCILYCKNKQNMISGKLRVVKTNRKRSNYTINGFECGRSRVQSPYVIPKTL